ncbi:TSCPD domain-containing protein [Bacilli bacterium]|nr:TSCPD domain-containing protein [Bacilli bacterium]
MKYEYRPQGTCSQTMMIEVNDDQIKSLKVIGGCHGNLQGIARLVIGMKIDDVIAKLQDVKCKTRDTSCPDQLAKALRLIKENKLESIS